MKLVATKSAKQLGLEALHRVRERLVIAFTIIALIFWQLGMGATAEAAVVAGPPKPKNTVTSSPYSPILRFELAFILNPYLPFWRLEPIW
jgi:hypothetical protein